MSKIEVNEIDAQSGSTITVGSACKSVAVPGNVVKTNAVQASDAGNIISQSGTTITIGASGDTVSLASGASQSGFGRSGTVDWQTGSIKTSTFTAVSGQGFFADTSSGAFTMNLPAGTAGAIVSVADYTNTFQTNNLTIAPNGSQKIGGVAAPIALSTEGQSVTFVYVDDTEGWKNVQDSTSNVTGNPFLQASGGTESTCGNCRIHVFTGPGTFTVAAASVNCASENIVSYLVVGGGGSGGGGGGGGAGGFREVKNPITPYTASPLDGYPNSPNRITVTAQAYPITVGGGGSPSTFSTITSTAGGSGGHYVSNNGAGNPGGSGGGGVGTPGAPGAAAGSGNTPPTSPAQGTNGGAGNGMPNYRAGGGGGASASGGTSPATSQSGNGGNGVSTSITGSSVTRAGGGGGSNQNTAIQSSNAGTGGSGGGGGGAATGGPSPLNRPTGVAGTVNTGGGGGGGFCVSSAGGGSGIVVIRYKFK